MKNNPKPQYPFDNNDVSNIIKQGVPNTETPAFLNTLKQTYTEGNTFVTIDSLATTEPRNVFQEILDAIKRIGHNGDGVIPNTTKQQNTAIKQYRNCSKNTTSNCQKDKETCHDLQSSN